MISFTAKRVTCVVIYTCYDDGTCDFTQDAVRKDDFATIHKAFVSIIQHMADVVRNRRKCPFNPDNPTKFKTDTDGDNQHFG